MNKDVESITVLSGRNSWNGFKNSFLNYCDKFPDIRGTLMQHAEPDWTERMTQVLNQLLKEEERSEESSASAAAAKTRSKSKASAQEALQSQMEQLQLKSAFDSMEEAKKQFRRDCFDAMRVLFLKISPSIYSTLEAHYKELEEWRRNGNILKIWGALSNIYCMGDSMAPALLKIEGMATKIDAGVELTTFIIQKETLLREAADRGVAVSDQEYKDSLIYGLTNDHRFSHYLQDYFGKRANQPATYEDLKAELNQWMFAKERLHSKFMGKKIQGDQRKQRISKSASSCACKSKNRVQLLP